VTSVEAAALTWLARLPLLGDEELALLLGAPAYRGLEIRLSLERLGWVEWLVPGTEAIAQRRLSFLRPDALPALATALGTDLDLLVQQVPVRERDVHDRIGRLVTTAWVNRFVAGLANSPDLADAEVVDARSLPLALNRGQRWWPSGTHAYVCLRAGRLWAPFFLAWDRSASPDSQRRRLADAWRRGGDTPARRWSPVGLPPVLLVAADPRALGVWSHALETAVDAGEAEARDFGLTTARKVAEDGPGGTIWRHLGSDRLTSLVEFVGWGPRPDLWVPVVSDLPVVDRARARSRPFRERAPAIAVDRDAPVRARLAALTAATDGEQKALLQWIGRHPLLSAPELAGLLRAPRVTVERRLDWLIRCGVCTRVSERPSLSVGHEDESEARYILTELGLRSLAADVGTAPALLARDGGITHLERGPEAQPVRAVRHYDHTVGLNAFMTRLADDAQRLGGRLLEWRNEAESTQRFVADGRTSWIRPDASGRLVLEATMHPFIVEYDRGTLDAGDYRPKLEAYARYFRARAWEESFHQRPRLLFVCSDTRAEERVVRAMQVATSSIDPLLTTTWRLKGGAESRAGALGLIWSPATGGSGQRRRLFEAQRTEAPEREES